ncbi:hypothetical protein [Cryobacterium sp. PH31-O1]|nr:hypothetical protein [Cryobacterium sp. PH31-O1]MDJ0338247.1 hypothetical protein [Cryobacterium sp. PH31-O1]
MFNDNSSIISDRYATMRQKFGTAFAVAMFPLIVGFVVFGAA